MRRDCSSETIESRRQTFSSSSSQARCFAVMARFDMVRRLARFGEEGTYLVSADASSVLTEYAQDAVRSKYSRQEAGRVGVAIARCSSASSRFLDVYRVTTSG